MSPPVSRAAFEAVYDRVIRPSRFHEVGEYYEHFVDRYWNTFPFVERALPAAGGRMLDIGAGQFALLATHLLGARCDVADLRTAHTEVLERNGIGFVPLDLSRDRLPVRDEYDLVVLAEVIEHVPIPPHVVFERLRDAIRPGGRLLVTTPNLYRLRNLVRMALGRHLFDLFVMPDKVMDPGHFLEYAQDQIEWHLREAGFEIEHSSLEQLSYGGASRGARVARALLRPALALRPLWRDNLVVVARRPAA